MLGPLAIALLIGILVAQRFRVTILAPLFALTVVLAICAAIAHPGAAWNVSLTAIATGVGLQIGYLFGLGIRYLRTLARARRLRAAAAARTWPPERPAPQREASF